MEKKNFHLSRRSIALTLALALVVGIVFMVPTLAADTSNMGQLVDYFSSNNQVFTLNSGSRFFLTSKPSGDLLQTVQLAQRQFAADGIPSSTPMPIVWGDVSLLQAGDILVQLVSGDSDIGEDGYKLSVTNFASVTAEDVDGLLYGLNTLQKHFRAAGETSIKGFLTYDTPDTKERTVQLDCARKYFTVEWICNFIREMSWMGYNSLQLHFSEDGGYRADLWDPQYYVEGHYEPENDFSWICGSHVQSWVKDPYRTDPDAGSYLTTAELIQIINTCKEYHIDIIPSFDSPAHMDYLTWKFEQHYKSNPSYSFVYTNRNGVQTTYKASSTSGCINYMGTTNAGSPSWPNYTTIDIRNTTRGNMAKAFVFSIYKDMADFFRYYAGSTKFNIGADEVNLSYSGAWSYDVFPGYINEVNSLLKARGYTSRMFNDFIKSDYIDQFDDDIEILYWNAPYDPNSGTDSEPHIMTVAQMVNDGRTLYNCIQTNTYYVLRIVAPSVTDSNKSKDARDPSCTNWTFYHSTEDLIYNEWYPADISEHGLVSQDVADVPAAQLGGGYFLLWNDYAAVNTEVEMWNGVYDQSGSVNNGVHFYSLLDRMWSNTIKQWNADIDRTLTFQSYATLRDSMGDFPGLGTGATACQAKTTLPAATEPIHLADHTELKNALATEYSESDYTAASYAIYKAAYNDAVAVNKNGNATAAQIGAALDALNAAIAQLEGLVKVTVVRKTTINGVTLVVDTLSKSLPTGETNYELSIPALNGYTFIKADGCNFIPSTTGDGSGSLSGTTTEDITITLWYENTVNSSRLDALLEEVITEKGNFTTASWNAYMAAVENARNFVHTVNTRQSEVDALVKALENARTALVIASATTSITVEKVANSFAAGKQIGLHVYTTPNLASLTITDKASGDVIAPTVYSGEVQELNDGSIVKYWLIFFPAGEAGTYTYLVSNGNNSTEVTVTVS